MMKKIFIYSILLAVFSLFSGCNKINPGNTEDNTGEAIRATVAVVKLVSFTDFYEAVGTVKAETASTLSGKLLGTIKAVNVREGDRITKGQPLILIDDRQVSAQLKQAKAAFEEASRSEAAAVSARDAARAGAQMAQATYRRFQKLIEENAASSQEFEEVEMRSRQAEAALRQAEEALEAAKERVKEAEAGVASSDVSRKDAVISAPFDGIVTARMVDVGDLSSPGTPFLDIEKTGAIEVDAIIPEEFIRMIKPRQDIDVNIPALKETPIKGKVKSIITAVDPQSRTFTVKIALPETAGVHSGMFARINIPRNGKERFMIPCSALILQGQLTGLFVLDAEKTAHFRIIRTGRKIGEQIEVISGIKEGTYYVVSPPAELKEGMKVETAS